MIKKWQTFEVVIEKLWFWWEWIAKIDNFVFFIKWALPGQKVKAVLQRKKQNCWYAKAIEILEQSPLEITAQCKHFWTCWGCKWQNLDYKKQLEFKENQITECLEHLWGFSIFKENNNSSKDWEVKKELDSEINSEWQEKVSSEWEEEISSEWEEEINLEWEEEVEKPEIFLEDILPSPDVFSYRNKVEFSFGYQSMSQTKDEEWNKTFHDVWATLWFHKPWKWEEVVALENCDLVTKWVNNVFHIVKKWALEIEWFEIYNQYSRKWFWRHLLVRENLKWDLMLWLICAWELSLIDEEKREKLNDLLQEAWVKSFYSINNQNRNDDWSNSKATLVFWEENIFEEILWLKFAISPKSFFQTNSRWAEQLYSVVKEFSEWIKKKIILDLYCWTWTIGQILAKGNKAEVIWVEYNESAVEDANTNAELNWLKNTKFICWKVEKRLPWILEKYWKIDLIVIDPPRAWMHKKAVETILEFEAKEMIYVSCNPATFARDAKLLSAKYEIEKIKPVDMFPHTSHIELVAKLKLKG